MNRLHDRVSFLPLTLSLFVCVLQASSQWQWQNPLPQGNRLSRVQFVDEQTVWASSDGSMLKSTTGEVTWQVITPPTRIYGQAMFFLDRDRGWIGGQGMDSAFPAHLLGTTNGGLTWTTQLNDSFGDFEAITFVNERQGWAAGQGAHIFHTTNSGMDWYLQNNLPIQSINALWFTDSLHGWGAGSTQRRVHTSDGGATWLIDTISIFSLNDITFIDSLRGWQCGDSRIEATTDGGLTWQVQLDSLQQQCVDLHALNPRLVWATSNRGHIVATTDGGASWSYQTNPNGTGIGKGLYGIAFRDSLTGTAVGTQGVILITSNGGASWTNLRQAVTLQPLFGIHFLNQEQGWVSGPGGTILKTSNGGMVWDSLTTNSTASLADVFFIDAARGWAVGGGGTILRTTDGGTSWFQQSTPIVRGWADIELGQQPIGWIVGYDILSDSRLLKTTDGGETWNLENSFVAPPGATQVQFTSPDIGWIMVGSAISGSMQVVYRTINGGASWSSVLTNNADTMLSSISFVDDSVGWVSTVEYTILRTTDAGISWQGFPTPEFFRKVFFKNLMNGWAASSSGEIYSSNDGGQTWIPQLSGVGGPLYDILFVDSSLGWAIGVDGTIIHTTNGGTTYVAPDEESIPIVHGFALLANYPNPFNGQTVIRFLSDRSLRNAKLTIYDILGHNVFEVSFEWLNAGANDFLWHGKNTAGQDLASGVYLYQIRTSTHSFTNKMLLLR